MTIHQEWWFGDELESAVRAAPDTPFIWAHAGHGAADVVRRLLSRNPNLHADLSARSPWLGPGHGADAGGRLAGRCLGARCSGSYADRFLVGFDLFVPGHYQTAYAQQMVGYYRSLLGQLEPDIAGMIAAGNAALLAPFVGGLA